MKATDGEVGYEPLRQGRRVGTAPTLGWWQAMPRRQPRRKRCHSGRHAPGSADWRAAAQFLGYREHHRGGALPAAPPRPHRQRHLAGRGADRSGAALKAVRSLADEAVKYLAVMTLVDGILDHAKLRMCCATLAHSISKRTISPSMAWTIADMTHKNFDSVTSRSSADLDRVTWIKPYVGDQSDPALMARYEALGELPQNTFGKALWDFDKPGVDLHRRHASDQSRCRPHLADDL